MNAFRTMLFVSAFVAGVQLDFLLQHGLHDTIVMYADHNWFWNNAVRLPYLAVIQLVLIATYLRIRTAGRDTNKVMLTALLPLGWVSGTLLFRFWDWCGTIAGDVFGVTMTWTPHYMTCWVAYAVTTVAVVEGLLALRWCLSKFPR